MKKRITTILIILVLTYAITAVAGSIPEDLLSYDEALVFFGEVTSYDGENNITVLPTQKIKGDVVIGTKQSYDEALAFGNFSVNEGEQYLIAYFNENNPLYLWRITSSDSATLKILNKTGEGMEERMEDYLNAGRFEQAESERLAKVNGQATPTVTPEPKAAPTVKKGNDFLYRIGGVGIIGAGIVVVLIALVYIFRKRK